MIKLIPVLIATIPFLSSLALSEERPPNIVYIMSDELAYFELSHMGNPYIKTPNIDKMAKQGIRFTNALAASPVCAPLRCNLMTGKHAGHASVRSNDGGTPLRADEATIASVLKQKNYATGGFGKWGAGGRGSTGVPEKHGFDEFFGYYDQVHAHSFYPPYLIRNSKEISLQGNIGGRTGLTYSHYPIVEAGLKFIRKNKNRPFFAYFPITPPHGMYDIPADDPAWDSYAGEDWIKDPSISQDTKNYAAMVTMIDNNLGTILDLLKELKLDQNTVVFFTGDNGGQDRFASKANPRGFFGPNVDPKTGVAFRGGKGNLYEGGLKIPFLVQWPGKIAQGKVSNLIFYQVDMMATLADISGTIAPDDTDGISILPELLGKSTAQKKHKMLYWEYGNQVAVRFGKWKAIRPGKDKQWELYHLQTDISETRSVAEQHPDILKKMREFATQSHSPAITGTYSDPARVLHERDRWAKHGTSRIQEPKKPSGTVYRISSAGIVPFDQMSIIGFSSENHANDRKANYAIDGKLNTVWHSRFSIDEAKPPHHLIIDLGQERKISGFQYLGRQDKGWNGTFANTEFFVSNSAQKFSETPTLKQVFTKTKRVQKAELPKPVTGRYVKVKIYSEVNGTVFASAADIAVSLAK